MAWSHTIGALAGCYMPLARERGSEQLESASRRLPPFVAIGDDTEFFSETPQGPLQARWDPCLRTIVALLFSNEADACV